MIKFRKKIVIIPGILSINLNKGLVIELFKTKSITEAIKKASVTLGFEYAGVNISKDGVELNANAPGTGIAYRSKRFKPKD